MADLTKRGKAPFAGDLKTSAMAEKPEQNPARKPTVALVAQPATGHSPALLGTRLRFEEARHLGDLARPIRVAFANAVYDVAARGNEFKATYCDAADRVRFLETVEEALTRLGAIVHAHCLLPNDFHRLLETPRVNASTAAGWLQTTYDIRFNRRHRPQRTPVPWPLQTPPGRGKQRPPITAPTARRQTSLVRCVPSLMAEIHRPHLILRQLQWDIFYGTGHTTVSSKLSSNVCQSMSLRKIAC